ncbi:Non-reducing end beta-L-arabinofuranosidase [Frondihabitans sp. 762G35]|uniref:glycoside hydrolase family 127 protein n=1 Tax=Frondihabitans sp. 762G35 TaxID=1446794 RepID=UPI000D225512|nr:beta-L-arabinofuranosidase domain-containing protein [Frondihabitans sp. 762G35]ARC57826.1 Non-reducing end beta-L-arabinofuranosidase [Frondihabitans sp. 762G35]
MTTSSSSAPILAPGEPRRAQPVVPTGTARTALRPLDAGAARIDGGFWALRQERNGAAAVREAYDLLEKAGNFANLRIAAGLEEGQARGPIFMDSDIYKWLEAVAFEYGRVPADDLLRLQREVTDLVARAQADDGYLDSVQQILGGVEGRYTDLPWSHEMYCAGHLFQAAVAQVRATSDTALLDVAVRLADHLDATFGPGKRQDVDGHPVVEMGLVELARETGERRYLDLAAHFVEARGRGYTAGLGKESTYFSDRVPVREAVTVEGHAVRAVYLGAGATDVAIERGDADLLGAVEGQFAAMMSSKAFITGGLGARWDFEAFGDPYELPGDRGYAESCAAIGGVQWAWRLLLATGKPVYADAIERFLFNAFLPGVSLRGTEYFYVNPLQLREGAHADENRSPAHGRRGWFDCACCPPNIMRTFASLDAYLATTREGGLQLHQFAPGTFDFAGGAVRVETDYPWSGSVGIEVTRSEGAWSLDLRIPAWSDETRLAVNGEAVDAAPGTYARITRDFRVGDIIRLDLDLTPRVYAADARIDASRGAVAVERGPLVYALESHDSPGVTIDDATIDLAGAITETERPDLLDGIVTLEAAGRVPSAHAETAWPYRRVRAGDAAAVRTDEGVGYAGADPERAPEAPAPVPLTLVPYYAWANRGAGSMRVWIPVD